MLSTNLHRTLKTAWPSAWDTRRWPPSGRAGKRRRKGVGKPCRENGAPNINWSKWPVDVVNDTKRHSPEKPYALQWKVVNGQIVHLPLSNNREGLVGGYFDQQPNNRNALLCKIGCYHFDNCHISVTAKGGCLWQQNNGNAKIRTPWWNISLMVTPACAESSVNTAARSSTPRPETANIAASRPAVTRCWICGKALKSVPNVERIPALAVGSSSCRSGQMPDIAAMAVGRKATASVKRMPDKYWCCFYLVKWYFPFWEVPKYRNA